MTTRPRLPEDLHTLRGAERFAEVAFAQAQLRLTQRGRLPVASWLLATTDPDGEPIGVKVLAVERKQLSLEDHQAAVGRFAEVTKAVGVLTIYETVDEVPLGESVSEDIDDLLGLALADTQPVAPQPALLAVFTHLGFRPQTRVWVAPIITVEGARTVGEFQESPAHEAAQGPYGRLLTFYC